MSHKHSIELYPDNVCIQNATVKLNNGMVRSNDSNDMVVSFQNTVLYMYDIYVIPAYLSQRILFYFTCDSMSLESNRLVVLVAFDCQS